MSGTYHVIGGFLQASFVIPLVRNLPVLFRVPLTIHRTATLERYISLVRAISISSKLATALLHLKWFKQANALVEHKIFVSVADRSELCSVSHSSQNPFTGKAVTEKAQFPCFVNIKCSEIDMEPRIIAVP